MTVEGPSADPAPAAPRKPRGIAFWSVASGLAAIVPVPLLDDHLVKVARRRMVAELARLHGVALDARSIQHLSGTEPKTAWGCIVGALFAATFKIAIKLLRRVFRTILFWLTLKDASDTASQTFHEGYLLDLGIGRLATLSALQDPDDPLPREVRSLRARVERVTREVDTGPMRKMIRSAFRNSRGVLRRAARVLARREPRGADGDRQAEVLVDEIESEKGLGSLISRLAALLSTESRYWADLAQRFESAPETPDDDLGERA